MMLWKASSSRSAFSSRSTKRSLSRRRRANWRSFTTITAQETMENTASRAMISLVEMVPAAIIRQTLPNSPVCAADWMIMRRGRSTASFVVLAGGVMVQLEEVAHRVQHAGAPAVAGRLAQARRGRVQQLVQQRARRRVHRRAVVVRQVAETGQRALRLLLPHPLAVVAQRADGGDHGERRVPGPEALHAVGHDPLGRGKLRAAAVQRVVYDL